jgi:hypothetical protein
MLEALKRVLARNGVIVYRHMNAARGERLRFINSVKQERDLLLSHVEAEQLINSLVATARIPGDIAEVGTFRGASARLLRAYGTTGKLVHVFDTFSGLPEPGAHDADFRPGQFASHLEDVKRYLGEEGIRYHVGMFPQSAVPDVEALRFSFVHLDVDLYEGTRDCLGFFYPRLNTGGIVVSHDFGADRAPGVVKAFREYFDPLGIPFVQLSGYQGLAVKLG